MANYQRYQTLSSAEQYMYCPDCPIWVNRYQLSWDTQTSARLLQCRMVNVSEKTVLAVYLRIHCRDAQGSEITTLHLVPITGLHIAPGEIFGDDKVVNLWPNRTAFAEIFAERVCFGDGTAWNEPNAPEYLAIPPAIPVRQQDPVYPQLVANAAAGGARNDYYFRAFKNAWSCTCGVPNSNQMLYCRHCGVDRSWLELNMDAERLLMPPEPEPEPEPEPAPPPEPKIPPRQEYAAPLEKFDLATYLSNEPIARPRQEEFPVIPKQPAPEKRVEKKDEEDDEPEKSHTGRIVAIILAVLVFLGIGGWVAYRQFIGPYSMYQKGVELQNQATSEADAAKKTDDAKERDEHYKAAIQGYEDAIAQYETLAERTDTKEYEESLVRIQECREQIGLTRWLMGEYAAAYEIFEELGDFSNCRSHAADCLLSLGVLAYNSGEYETAWDYVEQLQSEYSDYDKPEKLQELHNNTAYRLGEKAMENAMLSSATETIRESYGTAKRWFTEAGSFNDSPAKVNECDFMLADLTGTVAVSAGDAAGILSAVDQFAAMPGFAASNGMTSEAMRQKYMLAYCELRKDPSDNTVYSFLSELCDIGYPGALDCMYACCAQNRDPNSWWMVEYLTYLSDRGYPGAQELREELYPPEVTVDVLRSAESGMSLGTAATLSLEELEKVAVRYRISGGSMRLALEYTLCGEDESDVLKSETMILNDNGSAEGTILLKDLISEEGWPTEGGLIRLRLLDANGEVELELRITVTAEAEET